jgi:NADH:ubiquinone oxidoreductase subunit 4 (subunit M)
VDAGLSVIGILYGGLTALAQNDLKKLVAYSSVGHMGFATLGIFASTAGRGGRGAGDDQPRHHHRRALHLRRRAL